MFDPHSKHLVAQSAQSDYLHLSPERSVLLPRSDAMLSALQQPRCCHSVPTGEDIAGVREWKGTAQCHKQMVLDLCFSVQWFVS